MQCKVRLTILGVRQHVDESYATYACGPLDGFEWFTSSVASSNEDVLFTGRLLLQSVFLVIAYHIISLTVLPLCVGYCFSASPAFSPCSTWGTQTVLSASRTSALGEISPVLRSFFSSLFSSVPRDRPRHHLHWRSCTPVLCSICCRHRVPKLDRAGCRLIR